MLRIASSCMILVTVLDTPSAYGTFHGVSTAEKEEPQVPASREGGRRPGEARGKSRTAWPSRPSAAHCPGWRTCSNIPYHRPWLIGVNWRRPRSGRGIICDGQYDVQEKSAPLSSGEGAGEGLTCFYPLPIILPTYAGQSGLSLPDPAAQMASSGKPISL